MLLGSRLLITLALFSFLPSHSWASEIRNLYRSARAQAMGGAYVGLADDESAIFLNPAGLAGVVDPFVNYGALDIDLAQDIYGLWTENSSIFSNFSLSSLNALIGTNTYGRVQYSPSFVIPNFGIALLVDGQTAFYAKNRTFPSIVVGYQTTNGIQMAYGVSVSGRRKRVGRPDLRLGLGLKLMWRRGGYRSIPTTTLLNLSQGTSLIKEIAGNFGMGFGFDLGSQLVYPVSRDLELSFGSSFTEVGDMPFSSSADVQKGNWSVGAAMKYKSSLMDINVAYDFQNLNQSIDWRLKSHFGFEFDFPFLSIYGGINQVYLTYGVGIDLWFFRLNALSYAQELSPIAFQDPNRRYILSLDFRFTL